MKVFSSELMTQVGIGFLLSLVGIIMILVPESRASHAQEGEAPNVIKSSTATSVVHHLGTAILTGGILMMTVELFAKYREAQQHERTRVEQEHHLARLREVETEAMLCELLPDKSFFDQIKSQIIQRSIIRREMKVQVHLEWLDSSKTKIRKIFFVSYTIVNTSTTTGRAPVKIITDTKFPTNPEAKINHIEFGANSSQVIITSPDGKKPIEIGDGKKSG